MNSRRYFKMFGCIIYFFLILICTLLNCNILLIDPLPYFPSYANSLRLPSKNLKILIIGNSITYSFYNKQNGWYGNWGAAASCSDSDYAHRLIGNITAVIGYTPDVRIERTSFESRFQNCDDCCLPDIDESPFWLPDLVIVRIGDNIVESTASKNGFAGKYQTALQKLKRGDSAIVITTSSWFPNVGVDLFMSDACKKADVWYIPISDLFYSMTNQASSERSYANALVGEHPGDRGMRAITETLWPIIAGLLE